MKGWRKLAAQLIRFDGAYLRFVGDVTIEKQIDGVVVEPFTDEAIWELMYFGHARRDDRSGPPHTPGGYVVLNNEGADAAPREGEDMRIFLVGGSGVIGTRLIPQLIAKGHVVTATTRREQKLGTLAELGAEGLILDVLHADDVREAVAAAAPDVVLHMFTDLSNADLAANGRLRQVGTDNLVDATLAAGVQRMLVQSVTWVFPDGDRPATEDEPIVPGSPVDYMEARVSEIPHTTILRFGMFYGPGTWYAPSGRYARAVMAGAVPATPAITSFTHVDDAIAAAVQALEWPDGIYHVVDDEPAAGTVWLPVYADGLGAPAPRVEGVPEGAPLGRPISNEKARATGWIPAHPSWRDGFSRH